MCVCVKMSRMVHRSDAERWSGANSCVLWIRQAQKGHVLCFVLAVSYNPQEDVINDTRVFKHCLILLAPCQWGSYPDSYAYNLIL